MYLPRGVPRPPDICVFSMLAYPNLKRYTCLKNSPNNIPDYSKLEKVALCIHTKTLCDHISYFCGGF